MKFFRGLMNSEAGALCHQIPPRLLKATVRCGTDLGVSLAASHANLAKRKIMYHNENIHITIMTREKNVVRHKRTVRTTWLYI
jgi:hypothetical protein